MYLARDGDRIVIHLDDAMDDEIAGILPFSVEFNRCVTAKPADRHIADRAELDARRYVGFFLDFIYL